MRLDKYIASTTDYSRSQTKQLIKAGVVSINGQTASNPSVHVNTTGDCVRINQQQLQAPQHRYFMLNKPADYVCSGSGDYQPTVMDLINEPNKNTLQIAGRLDKDSTGLVLLTDDGQWNHRVTSPSTNCFKQYRVTLAEPLCKSLIECFKNGMLLKNETRPTRPADLHIIDSFHAELAIQEGKYHQVKRMFAAAGNRVTNLHRFCIGPIALDTALNAGHYRPLSPEEINHFN